MALSPKTLTLSPAHPVGLLAHRDDVLHAIPHAKRLSWQGEPALAIPHAPDEARVLRNLGVAVEPPILRRYDWRGCTPFASQKTTAAMLVTERRAFVLSEPGVGKTRAALFAFDYLRTSRLVKTMLVVAPLSTLRTAWLREIQECMPHLSACVVHGPAVHREKLLRSDAFDIYIINHDGLRHSMPGLMARNFDVLCYDELTGFKASGAQRSRAAQRLAAPASYVWGLTGTPTPNGPEDAYGQVKLVLPANVPTSAARWKDMTMQRVSTFRWVPKADSTALVQKAMSPAVRFRRSDVMELPPMQFTTRDAPMSAKQEKVYKTIMKNLLVTLQSGKAITVANAGVLFMKTLQIATGFVLDNDGAHHMIDPAPRLNAVSDAIDEWEGRTKFLVFNPFRMGVKMLHDHLAGQGRGVALIDGSTSEKKRFEIFERFRDDPSLAGIVAHPRCMSHGVTLVEANLIVWSSPYPSLEVFEQANARISRPGQTKSQLVVQVTGSKVEDAIYTRLRQRGNLQRDLLRIVEEGMSAY
jgi:SNF2 family DNA or RNA helicase